MSTAHSGAVTAHCFRATVSGLGHRASIHLCHQIPGLPRILSALPSQQASPRRALREKTGSGKNIQNEMVEIKEGQDEEKGETLQSDSMLLTSAVGTVPAALPTRTFCEDRNVLKQSR